MKTQHFSKTGIRGFSEIRALYADYYYEKNVLNNVLVTPIRKPGIKADSTVRTAIKRKLVEERMSRWLQSFVTVVLTGAALWVLVAGYIINKG